MIQNDSMFYCSLLFENSYCKVLILFREQSCSGKVFIRCICGFFDSIKIQFVGRDHVTSNSLLVFEARKLHTTFRKLCF